MTTEFRIPDLGGASDVDVIEVAVVAGDQVEPEQTLLVLETDKASMEIPAEAAGTVLELKVAAGDKVNEGDVFMVLDVASVNQENEEPSAPSAAASEIQQDNATAATAEHPPALVAEKQPEPGIPENQPGHGAPSASRKVHAGPAVRKLARELGVDLTQVTASGRKQRITKDDVQRFVKQRLGSGAAAVAASAQGIPAVPEVDFSKFGPIRQEPLNNIKRATAKAMTTAWLNVPQVTQFDLADITELESYRKQQNEVYKARGIRFSIVPFVLKAIARVMREFPQFGASLSADGESLIIKDYVHIGVAVDTPKGLLVPVIHNVDRLSVTEITQLLNEKAQYAREGKLTLRDMQGGCFSLSSLGGIGGTAFTPIVNPPEVAILGLSKAEFRPQWNGQEFVPRLMLPLSLSYDHRVIDGAEAARFSQRLVACLQDLRNVLM
ncbi:2-oxo acid dehydrogenase subunit E2 [Bacterioplanoides pacificum]|uniref:Dihydrolipoamide acetyltransferase component of pyruvate dehydrogenase complex n=1 Tax=Bacterioplanoides pacificum TaxID=1171596 RepID=A0ABV7VVM7_9GAMM